MMTLAQNSLFSGFLVVVEARPSGRVSSSVRVRALFTRVKDDDALEGTLELEITVAGGLWDGVLGGGDLGLRHGGTSSLHRVAMLGHCTEYSSPLYLSLSGAWFQLISHCPWEWLGSQLSACDQIFVSRLRQMDLKNAK